MIAQHKTRPLCFVLMPFGTKPGEGCGIIDFDAVYCDIIRPAVLAAGLSPIRADEEQVDLFLSYRAIGAYEEMISLVDKMSQPLARTVLVREQLGFAFNRLKRREEAERVLLAVIDEHGPSSETCGILGRVYKDQWHEARIAGKARLAAGIQKKCVEMYVKGFESDWRDAYPGINAVTMMEFAEQIDPRQAELLPVVEYSVKRRLSVKPDYWDYATLLELATLKRNEAEAFEVLPDTLAAAREYWELETTHRNLSLIKGFRQMRGEETEWLLEILEALAERLRRWGGIRIKKFNCPTNFLHLAPNIAEDLWALSATQGKSGIHPQ